MIENELTLLNHIYNTIYNGCNKNFDSFIYTYKINDDENWESISIVYFNEGNIVSKNDFELINEEYLEYLTKKLNVIMENRTKGKWTKMIFSFLDGQINTKFSYVPQSLT